MTIIDADKFLSYLILSKHIDGLTCGEVKEAVEMCKVDVLDKIRAEILLRDKNVKDVRTDGRCFFTADEIFEIIDKYRNEVSECR